MIRRATRVTAAAAAAANLIVAGCGDGGPAQRTLDEPRGGSQVALKRGQDLVVGFNVNYGVGTDWALGSKPAPAVVSYRRSDYRPDGPQLPGSGGRERFFFAARGKGRTHAVFLRYFRGKLTERRDLQIVVS